MRGCLRASGLPFNTLLKDGKPLKRPLCARCKPSDVAILVKYKRVSLVSTSRFSSPHNFSLPLPIANSSSLFSTLQPLRSIHQSRCSSSRLFLLSPLPSRSPPRLVLAFSSELAVRVTTSANAHLEAVTRSSDRLALSAATLSTALNKSLHQETFVPYCQNHYI
nr:uncharacterized protein CTRU02_07703 [Colletotrichum truncatum]KAF6790797.1 hypothetical protein CTRU02_07703 [Colletotrichum truncatum]